VRTALYLVRRLEVGADPNLGRGDDPITPLHYAAYGGFSDIVKRLLAAGADHSVLDGTGNSPLRFALMQSAHAKVACALLAAGAAFEEIEDEETE
jgi:ankyrin repeat protein